MNSRNRSPQPGRHRPVCALEDEGGPVDQGGDGEQPGGEELEVREATYLEKKEHEASGHAVYRSWCPECIQAAGRVQQRRRVPRQKGDDQYSGDGLLLTSRPEDRHDDGNSAHPEGRGGHDRSTSCWATRTSY